MKLSSFLTRSSKAGSTRLKIPLSLILGKDLVLSTLSIKNSINTCSFSIRKIKEQDM